MIVVVQLHKLFQGQTQDGRQWPFEVTLLSGSSLADLVLDLGVDLPLNAIQFEVNERRVGPDTALQDGDYVQLNPVIVLDDE
jgi:hypothetical protein